MTIWRTRIACWITEATDTHTHTHTHSEYVILIAFPRQQWLQERASLLRLYVHYLFSDIFLTLIFLKYTLLS
jgi:hypothetical protein